MKRRLLIFLSALLPVTMPAGRAAIVYSGVQDIAIPQDFNGVYLNIVTGATAFSQPGTWNTESWLNPFFGGVGIGNSVLLLPLITGADQIVKLASGVTIGSGSNFALGESGSSTHVGPAANQFQIATPGFMGFKWQPPGGGFDYYGWLKVEVNNVGVGKITDWAYESTSGTSIQAGAGAVAPILEPGTVLFGLVLLGVGLARQRRRRYERDPFRGMSKAAIP